MINAGIDIGGTKVKIGLIEDSGEKPVILSKLSFDTPIGNFHKLCSMAAYAVTELLNSFALKKEDLCSLGIAVPGSVDQSGRTLKSAFNLQMFDAPFASEMEEYFPGIPVQLSNDANTAALAELYAGAFMGYKNALLLTLGTGLGGGIIIDGKLFNGGQNRGSEAGHVPFMYGGEICSCGLSGCVENYTSATWIKNQGRKRLGKDFDDAKAVLDAAKCGNEIAVDIFNHYVDNLAAAIGGFCTLLDPELVALGGGLSAAGDFLFVPLKEKVKERNFLREEYDIVPAKMGNDAGIVGAAMLYKNSLTGGSHGK